MDFPCNDRIFDAKAGTGNLIAGEVLKVSDDNTDNYFIRLVCRFADIEAGEPILHPLCNECVRVFK